MVVQQGSNLQLSVSFTRYGPRLGFPGVAVCELLRSVLTPRVAGCRRRADMSGSHLGVAVASHKATGSRTPVSERGSSSTPGTSPGAVCSMPPSCSSRCACSVVQL